MKRDPDELAATRERFAADLDELRGNLQEELGWAPRGLRWIVPIVALAAGLVAGIALKRNLPRRRRAAALPKRRALKLAANETSSRAAVESRRAASTDAGSPRRPQTGPPVHQAAGRRPRQDPTDRSP